ncbi:MAG: GNAT family N-acetyltransferase [Acidimicrobiales bacterium]
MTIRRAAVNDVPTIARFIRDLATYEKSEAMVSITTEHLEARLFCDKPNVFCELVETDEGDAAGFAVWFLNFSTWTGTHGIFLEDLFVSPEFRGRGYGTELLKYLARECVEKGYHRLQWSVLDWNTASIDFYRSLGAEAMDEWTVYRVTDDALVRLSR